MRATSKRQKYYFPDKLKKQLNKIPMYPLTVIEASGGFGKTSAVREYLRNEHPNSDCEWYTCLGESGNESWAGICQLFAGISNEVYNDMKSLDIPIMDTLHYIRKCLKKLKCRKESYLIIDNYHLADFDIRRDLINIFSMHEVPNLHVIFITRQLNNRWNISTCNDNIHIIDSRSLYFERNDISGLFQMEGIQLNDDEVESIFKCTDGWISAIRLQMLNYMETGSIAGTAGIECLVETVVWNECAHTEKEFMVTMSVFDSFTAFHVTHMFDCDAFPGEVEIELKKSDFIRFFPDNRRFVIHRALLDYLRNQFYNLRSNEYRECVFIQAGHTCASMGEYYLAAKFFYRVRDFESIFSMPFTFHHLDKHKEMFDIGLFIDVVNECPCEILCKYPSTMIAFAYHFLLNMKYEIYEKLRKLLSMLIAEKKMLSQKEVHRIKGELILLKSFESFNDISKMREGYERACNFLGETPNIIESGVPWFSVFPTAFGMFWRNSGMLDEMLRIMDEIKSLHHGFGSGQGAGLAYLIRAEAVLNRGEDNEAEILCYKAIYEARAKGQVGICIYAELCLARVFTLRGDSKSFLTVFKSIQGYATGDSELSVKRMVDICLSIISLLLGIKDYVAPWLYDIDVIRKSLYMPVVPFAEIIHFRLLLLDKRYNEMHALIQISLDELENTNTDIRYRMPQMYYFIFLAIANHNNGKDLEAKKYLKNALDIAITDRIYLPFAEQKCIADLLSGLKIYYYNLGVTGNARDQKTDNNNFSKLLLLCKRQEKGIREIKKTLLQSKSPLTPREREIAMLAKKRLSAREISEKLYISEKTVKSTLGRVYNKLGIHSKRELTSVEF